MGVGCSRSKSVKVAPKNEPREAPPKSSSTEPPARRSPPKSILRNSFDGGHRTSSPPLQPGGPPPPVNDGNAAVQQAPADAEGGGGASSSSSADPQADSWGGDRPQDQAHSAVLPPIPSAPPPGVTFPPVQESSSDPPDAPGAGHDAQAADAAEALPSTPPPLPKGLPKNATLHEHLERRDARKTSEDESHAAPPETPSPPKAGGPPESGETPVKATKQPTPPTPPTKRPSNDSFSPTADRPSTPKAATPSSSLDLPPNTLVELVGLKAAHFNGLDATILQADIAAQRYICRLGEGPAAQQVTKVKPENVRPYSDEELKAKGKTRPEPLDLSGMLFADKPRKVSYDYVMDHCTLEKQTVLENTNANSQSETRESMDQGRAVEVGPLPDTARAPRALRFADEMNKALTIPREFDTNQPVRYVSLTDEEVGKIHAQMDADAWRPGSAGSTGDPYDFSHVKY